MCGRRTTCESRPSHVQRHARPHTRHHPTPHSAARHRCTTADNRDLARLPLLTCTPSTPPSLAAAPGSLPPLPGRLSELRSKRLHAGTWRRPKPGRSVSTSPQTPPLTLLRVPAAPCALQAQRTASPASVRGESLNSELIASELAMAQEGVHKAGSGGFCFPPHASCAVHIAVLPRGLLNLKTVARTHAHKLTRVLPRYVLCVSPVGSTSCVLFSPYAFVARLAGRAAVKWSGGTAPLL